MEQELVKNFFLFTFSKIRVYKLQVNNNLTLNHLSATWESNLFIDY